MSINYVELCGVETTLKKLVTDLNMAFREGTLADVDDVLAAIRVEAREAGYIVAKLEERQ